MCGRFLFDADFDEIYNKLSIYENSFVINKRDFKPTDVLPVIISDCQKYKISHMSWGLKGYNSNNQLIINARSETIFEKQRYKNIRENRCIIPATRFFEPEIRGKKKIMHLFGTEDIMFFAGLYEKVQDNLHVTLITMDSISPVKQYHPRMPIDLNEMDIPKWLNGTNELASQIILNQNPIYKLMDENIQMSFF